MKTLLLLGSNNAKKRRELAAILDGLPIEITTPAEHGNLPSPKEDGLTFKANAEIKAHHYHRLTGLPTLADDSGLVVDALDGAPGIFSSRFAGEGASDLENCLKLLDSLKDIPVEERTARFVCSIVVVNGGKVCGASLGTCEGLILDRMEGQGGFGYDPMFFYPPEGKTFAELPQSIKNTISHRSMALQGILPVLKKLVKTSDP